MLVVDVFLPPFGKPAGFDSVVDCIEELRTFTALVGSLFSPLTEALQQYTNTLMSKIHFNKDMGFLDDKILVL